MKSLTDLLSRLVLLQGLDDGIETLGDDLLTGVDQERGHVVGTEVMDGLNKIDILTLWSRELTFSMSSPCSRALSMVLTMLRQMSQREFGPAAKMRPKRARKTRKKRIVVLK